MQHRTVRFMNTFLKYGFEMSCSHVCNSHHELQEVKGRRDPTSRDPSQRHFGTLKGLKQRRPVATEFLFFHNQFQNPSKTNYFLLALSKFSIHKSVVRSIAWTGYIVHFTAHLYLLN